MLEEPPTHSHGAAAVVTARRLVGRRRLVLAADAVLEREQYSEGDEAVVGRALLQARQNRSTGRENVSCRADDEPTSLVAGSNNSDTAEKERRASTHLAIASSPFCFALRANTTLLSRSPKS